MTTDTAIQEFEGTFRVLQVTEDGDDLQSLLEENYAPGDAFDPSNLTRVTFPREGDVWQFEDVTGKRAETEIIGVPVRQQVRRVFYASEYSGGDDAPDCSSADGIVGQIRIDEDGTPLNTVQSAYDNQPIAFGGVCAKCPMNQWESAQRVGKRGRGKACTEYRVIALLEPDGEMPLMVRLPPTQIKKWLAFRDRLHIKRKRISDVVVGLSIDDGELQVRLVGTLDRSTAAELRQTVQPIIAAGNAPQIEAPAPSGDFLEAPHPADDDGNPF